MVSACMSCRRFDMHLVTAAALRALLSTGNRIPIKTAMMPITTSNSTKVNPGFRFDFDLVESMRALSHI
jgi:hypothetical protein